MAARLEGKVALVTGAARGIGQGTALCLAEDGADVIVNDLHPNAEPGVWDIKGTVDEIEKLGRKALPYYADVADREQVAAMFASGIEHFGRIDIVVSNAAISIREPVVEAKWGNVLRTIEVSQFGVFHICQMAAQQMVRQGQGGKIVVISSVLSHVPMATSAPYNMAKAAINQLVRTMAIELAGNHINVNAINPGYIDTPGERKFATEEQMAVAGKKLPWGRLGTPRDIGQAAAFLASDSADYITGSILNVDGGYTVGLRAPVD